MKLIGSFFIVAGIATLASSLGKYGLNGRDVTALVAGVAAVLGGVGLFFSTGKSTQPSRS